MSNLKRDPANVPAEVKNAMYKKMFGAKEGTDALGHSEGNQLGADSSGNPADSSGDTGGEVPILDANEPIQTDGNLRGKPKGLRPGPSLEKQRLWANAPELLEAVKLAYRKHHLGDDTIGWDELSEKLLNALCEAMGDAAFQEWIEPFGQQED